MLQSLNIKNVALIKKATLEFDKKPKTKSAPALEKVRSFLIQPAKKLIIFFPKGTFKTKTASANCRIKPTLTVL